MKPLLLLEINEIPWRVVDLYLKHPVGPNLGRFFSDAQTWTTVAVDTGELSPWVTWPSLHRGLTNTEHGVLNLGQDPATFRGTPIWEEYRRAGHSIGVCGSMQSWPPQNPGPGGFYIPDTFAHDERCIPSHVEPFQKFNLNQVRKNGRVVNTGSTLEGAWELLRSLPSLGIRPKTALSVARQLISERFDKSLAAKRPIFQTVLLWDVFKSLFDAAHPPAFSTFFTNHVAGVMHRYWNHVFPEDFGETPASKPMVHKATMDFAMLCTDKILGDAVEFQEANPDLIVVFATSMGQAAVHRDDHPGYEASIPDLPKLMRVMGVETGEYKPLLAMVPQVAVGVADAPRRKLLKERLEKSHTVSGVKLFTVQEIGQSLSITIKTPGKADADAGLFHAADSLEPCKWEQGGIAMVPVDPGTAYHIPEGVFAMRESGKTGSDARTKIPADEVKGLLMESAGMRAVPAQADAAALG